MLTLDTTGDIRLIDGTFRVVGRLGNNYSIQNQSTGERSTATLADLYSRLLELPEPPAPKPAVELAGLTKQERAEVDLWASHIEEFTTGFVPGSTVPREGYDPVATTQNQRIERKIEELKRFNLPASRPSLLRKKRAYQAGGKAGLVDRRKGRQVGYFDRVDARVTEAMAIVIARQKNRSTVTECRLHDLVKAEVMVRYPGEEINIPSAATFYRHFKVLTKGKYTTGKATSRRSAGNSPKRTFGNVQRMLPGEEAQIDSTPLDIWVRTGKTGMAKPSLTIIQDRATRSIIGYSIRLVAATGYDHSLMLASVLVPFSARPDNADQRKLFARRYKDQPLLPVEERAFYEMSRPFIYPRRIMTDNGADFLSTTFMSACARFGIDVTHAASHTPTDKPHVERNFESIGDMFAQGLPGYVGNNPQNRGLDVDRTELLDVYMLNELFGDWVAKVWQNREHEGLRDLYDPTITYSPNQWFNATADFAGEVAFPFGADTFIELMPSTYRVIGTVGVQYGKRHYDSPLLHPYRGTPSNLPRRGNQWEVKYNPYDATRVWVRSPESTWIECRWRQVSALDLPHIGDTMQNLLATKRGERDDAAFELAALAGTPMPSRIPDAELIELYESDETTIFGLYDDEDETIDTDQDQE